MFLLLDNYDSFTYNLAHYLGELGADVVVRRNDVLTAADAIDLGPTAIVVSPGPGVPDNAGISLELIALAMAASIPLLGVCLGHQAIGQAFGGRVVPAPEPMHGKISEIRHQDGGVFSGLSNPFAATRYHSLVVARKGLPDVLEVTAETADGLIMGLQHKSLPAHGVQFHPESIASAQGQELLANFIGLATGRTPKPARTKHIEERVWA